MTLLGSDGRATISMPEVGLWRSQIQSASSPGATLDVSHRELGQTALEVIRRTRRLTSEANVDRQSATVDADLPNWEDACRALELVDLTEESVRRGKTLTVNNERLTEEDTFKGMMAAGGCLLLMATLMLLFLVAVVDGLRLPVRDWAVWRIWPVALLVLLGLFLILQLFKLVFPARESKS
jgi:hypothetical protein